MSCGSVGSAVRGFRLVNRQSAYGLRPTARELRPTARELRPKQPGVGRTQDKRPQGSQQAPSCMTSIRRWPGIATCLTIIRPFPANWRQKGGLNGYLFSTKKELTLRLESSGEVREAAVRELARGWRTDPETLAFLEVKE